MLTGCSEESIVGSVIYKPDLVPVKTEAVDPPTNAIGEPVEPPRIIIRVRNAGDGTAHSAHAELRLKRGGTIIESANGSLPRLAPGDDAVTDITLFNVDSHDAYDAYDCTLIWLDARSRGYSRSC